jgi:hypothetical protein
MATVIDALVMTLGLDVTQYDKNRKRVQEDNDKFRKHADSVAKDVAHGGKVMAEGFGAIKREVMGLLAVFGAATGIKAFIASNVQGQAELGRLSQNLGISAQSLEAWGLVAKEMGGQASDAFGALQSVASGLAEASIRGHSALTDMARANGVILTDAKGQVLGYEDALVSISKRLVELPRQQARYLADQLGVGSMFSQLMLGPDELRRRLDSARGMTRVTEASTAAAMRLQKQWADIQQRFKETSEIAFAKLSPVLERLAERFADWLDSVNWDEVGRKIESLVKGVRGIVDEFGGWKTVAIVLGGILALKVLAPVLGLITGLGRLIPLLATTTAGMAALATAGAAVAGGYVGTKIYEASRGTALGDWFQHMAAGGAALFGDKDAAEALKNERWNNMTTAQRNAVRRARGESLPGIKSSLPRGLRNNNPGNLNYAGQAGAEKESGPGGRFAVFGSMQEGIAALIRQLALYASRGIDTISEIVKKYAPAADGNNVAAYIAALVKATGKGANEVLDLTNLQTLIPLVQGIVRHEGNGNLSTEQVLGGIRLGARQQAMRSGGIASRTSTSETHIGKVEVHTQATDAKGIVRDIGHELSNNTLIAQADTGVQ